MNIDFTDKIKLYASTILVIIGLVSSLMSYFHFESIRHNGVYTSATITSVTEVRSDGKGRLLTFGNAVYYDTEHQMHTYSGYVGFHMSEGDTVELLYDRDNPDEVLRNTGSAVFLTGAVSFGILAVPLAILSLLSLKTLRKKISPPKKQRDFDD